MHDGNDAVRHDGSVARNTHCESELARLVDIYGLLLLDEPGQLLRLLSQTCPSEPKQTAALLAALGANIPQRLRGAKADERLPELLQESVRLLRERGTFDIEWAAWAVRAWAHALALPTRGLDDEPVEADSPTVETVPLAAPPAPSLVPSAPAVLAAPSAPLARSAPSAPTTPTARSAVSAPPVPAPATVSHTAKKPQVTPPTPAARATGRPARQRDKTFPPMNPGRQAPRSRREPVFVPDPDDVALPPPGVGGSDPVRAAAEPPVLVEPLFPDHDLRRHSPHAATGAPALPVAPDPGPGAAKSPVGAGGDAIVAPSWTRPEMDRPRQRGRPIVIALALIAVAAAALLVYDAMRPGADGIFAATRTTAGGTTTVAQAPASGASDPARPASAPAPAPDARTPPRPVAEATDPVASSAPTGAPTSAPTSAPTGVPTAAPASTTPAAPAPQAPVPAKTERGTVAEEAPDRPAVAPAPAPVIAATGPERSAAARPAITRIDVPRVVEGAPFVVTVALAGDVGNVASVERRVIDSGGSWPTAKVVAPVGALRRTGARELGIPFRAMDAPAYATLLFTVIGRDGARSEPKTATITVAGPTRVGDPTTSLPAAALPAPSGCAGTACGTVVESREIEPEVGTRGAVYQVVVRLDDRRTVAFTATYRLQTGSRVRVVDGRLLPAG